MLDNLKQVDELAKKYDTCPQDVLFIALNAMGLNNYPINSSRMRFYALLHDRPEKEFRFILSTGRDQSPFSIQQEKLLFKGTPIADVRDAYGDAAVIGYFRGNKDIITLNSNSRSVCTGCVFCPNTLEGSSDPQLMQLKELVSQMKVLANFNGLEDLSGVKEVNLSTGCFGAEDAAVSHLSLIRQALNNLNSQAQIGMLTSVIRTADGFARLKQEVGNFHLVLTAECFERRHEMLKSSKASLTPEQMPELLRAAKDTGHDTSFTYIVGLDSLETLKHHVSRMKPSLTRFPNFQVFQPHDPIMDIYAVDSAQSLEFYLKARKNLEEIFKDTPIRPESYSNYRSLWYYEFADENLVREQDRIIKLDDGHTPQQSPIFNNRVHLKVLHEYG